MKLLFLIIISFVFAGCAKVPANPPISTVSFLRPVHFPTGSHHIARTDQKLLEQHSLWLQSNRTAVVLLAGNADERGGDAGNMRLGDLRAREVKSNLIAKGVDPRQLLDVISFGERRPIDRRHCGAAWKMNRRVDLILR